MEDGRGIGSRPYDIEGLRSIVATLRGPQGCPWDRAQTHQSMGRHLIEEAYEAVESIDQGDLEHLKEELGDVLLQVVFHGQLAQESGAFTFDDVVDGIGAKLIFRHPHVFGQGDAPDAQQAYGAWEEQKRLEKGQKGGADTLMDIPRGLPALMRVGKLQRKVALGEGEDWNQFLAQAQIIEQGEKLTHVQEEEDPEEILGELLLAVAWVGASLGLDGERALHRACDAWIDRFAQLEKASSPLSLTQEVCHALWKTRGTEEGSQKVNTSPQRTGQ